MTADIIDLQRKRQERGLPVTRLERTVAVENMKRDPAAFMRFMSVKVEPYQVKFLRELTKRRAPAVDLRGDAATLCIVDEFGVVTDTTWRALAQEPFREPT